MKRSVQRPPQRQERDFKRLCNRISKLENRSPGCVELPLLFVHFGDEPSDWAILPMVGSVHGRDGECLLILTTRTSDEKTQVTALSPKRTLVPSIIMQSQRKAALSTDA